MSTRINAYQSCSASEQALLQVSAVAGAPTSRHELRTLLDLLSIRDSDGHAFNQKSLLAVLRRLEGLGLIALSPAASSCAAGISHHCLREAMAAGLFPRLAQAVFQVLPVKMSTWGSPFRKYGHFLSYLRHRLFLGDSPELLETVFEAGERQFPRESQEREPLAALFGEPFDGDYLRHFPPALWLDVTGQLLGAAWSALTPMRPMLDFLRQLVEDQGDQSQAAAQYLVYYLTLGGHWREVQAFSLAHPQDRRQLGLAGWHQALAGNDAEAIRLFAEDLVLLAKQRDKKKVFFQDLSGVFYLLALLRSGEAAHLVRADELLTMIDTSKGHLLRPYVPPLSRALRQMHGVGRDARGERSRWDGRYEVVNFCQEFFYILADFWENKERCRGQWLDRLAMFRDRAGQAEVVWLAAEAADLLARLGVEPERNGKLARDLREEHGLAPLLDIVRHVEHWERGLRALISLGSGGKGGVQAAKGAQGGQRLVWQLALNERYGLCDLAPRLQTQGKTGKWSAGRPVALKKLRQEAATMAGLTDQDREVCAAIVQEYESTYSGWGYGRREVYRFDTAAALFALVGHPHLVLESAPTTPIDLVAGEPELIVTRRRGRIEVTMQPEITDDSRTYRLVKETPSRYKLVRFSAQHKAIAAILESGLKAPEQAEAMAMQAIGALSSLITIHSDLGGGAAEAREVAADPRPHLHLLPYQGGLKAEILVRPFPAAEVWHRPGLGGHKVFTELAGEKLFAARDLKQEKEMAAQVLAACPTLSRQEEHSGEFLIPSPEDCLELLLEVREQGDGLPVVWPQGESLRLRGRASASGLSVAIKRERDWFAASGSLTMDDQEVIALQKLLSLLDQATGRFLPLDDGSFLALTEEFKSRLEELRACGEIHGGAVRVSPFAAFALDELSREAGQVSADRHWKNHLARFSETIEPELPSTLQAELRDYQVAGFRWLAQLSHWGVGACLADDMGLGKTLQTLAALLRLAPEGPSLVVAPLSVLMNWQDEARRFAPTLRVVPFGPGDRQQTVDDLQPFDLLVCSYGLLQTEAERLSQVAWQTIVLDEAQAIKNMHTKRSKAAMALNGRFKVITTGTPVENHLGELWNLFDFITPGLLGTFPHFSRTFMAQASPEEEKKSRKRLKKLIQPFILRRLKSQVLQELPARTEITMRVEMSPEERALYEAQRRKSLEILASSGDEPQGQQQIRILAEIMRLRRLCCNPALVLPNSGIDSAKLQAFGELLDDILGNHHKALVFSQFVDHLAILSRFLDERRVPYQYLDGSTPVAARRQRITDFQAGKGEVFLISLKAGGSGLNLTAADYVIHMDPWWNPAVEDQASDRAHRIGQQRPVTIYRLVMADSIEEQILTLHQEKRDLADSLLSGGDVSAKMSASELLALLKERE